MRKETTWSFRWLPLRYIQLKIVKSKKRERTKNRSNPTDKIDKRERARFKWRSNSKLTWIAWRCGDRANNCILLRVLLDGKLVWSLFENWRPLRCIDNANEYFSILRRSQSTAIDGGNVEPMIRLIASRQKVWSCHENFASYTINSKDSCIIASYDTIGHHTKSARVGITCHHRYNRCWCRRWFA